MQIRIHSQDIKFSRRLEQRLRDKMADIDRQFAGAVVAADIFLRDINGPRGGDDKHLKIRLSLRGRQTVVIETIRSSLASAIELSVRRARRTIRRHLHKQQRLEKQNLRSLHRSQVAAADA